MLHTGLDVDVFEDVFEDKVKNHNIINKVSHQQSKKWKYTTSSSSIVYEKPIEKRSNVTHKVPLQQGQKRKASVSSLSSDKPQKRCKFTLIIYFIYLPTC